MLHILLLILKIIGIILAVILGILLLLIGIVLFVPIRYEVSAKCDGTIETLKAKVKVTWLLHLFRADVFVKGKKLKWQIRAAWIKKSSAMAFGERKEGADDESKEDKSDYEIQKVEKTVVKDKSNEAVAKVVQEECESSEREVKEDRLEETKEPVSEKSEDVHQSDEASTSEKKKEHIIDKIKKLIEKIKTSIQNICDKVKDLLQKKEKITDFLTEESHVRAFRKAKKELFVLLKRLKPKTVNIKLRFGFEDPCTTGQVLGAISMLYPLFGDTTEIIPDFENQILKGNVYIKGRIRICHFASTALKLLLSKDVRKSYKDIRNFKL